MGNSDRVALVTGATSGLGYEAAAQLAERGYSRVIITGRTEAKANGAAGSLRERTGQDVFEILALDNDQLATVEKAARTLAARGDQIDALILNAGVAPPPEMVINGDGLESTVASTLIGHHLLTMRLLEADLLRPGARIVIAGSEAARGDVPTFNPIDIEAFAGSHFDGSLERSIEAYMKMESPAEYKAADTYATTKMFAVWWAARLADFLPEGVTVNVVSPGSTPDTNAIKNAPFYMRYFMVPMFKLIPGMSHSVGVGASRYLEATEFGDEVSGRFFASPPKKMTGTLVEMEYDHLDHPAGSSALWNVTSRLAGDISYPAAT
jgi:NAD(P)-dependent dehydrogenase (short-subunit alcohol dehydrogenase family)